MIDFSYSSPIYNISYDYIILYQLNVQYGNKNQQQNTHINKSMYCYGDDTFCVLKLLNGELFVHTK